jgi:hypothetical protein
MSLLFNLPSHLLSYIYSFDGTYQTNNTTDFRFTILLQSGAAHKLIDQYIQEMFAEDFVWHNNYGTFGNPNGQRLKLQYFYTQYKIVIKHDKNTNIIYFKPKPENLAEEDEEDEEDEDKDIRWDGFLTHNATIDDKTYIGVETFQQGGHIHLFVDDL